LREGRLGSKGERDENPEGKWRRQRQVVEGPTGNVEAAAAAAAEDEEEDVRAVPYSAATPTWDERAEVPYNVAARRRGSRAGRGGGVDDCALDCAA